MKRLSILCSVVLILLNLSLYTTNIQKNVDASIHEHPVKVEYLPMQQEQTVDEATKSNLLSVFGKLPLYFVVNQGQFPKEVIYYAKSEGATVFCTEQGSTFGFAEGSISLKFSEDRRVKPSARDELPGKVNYFIGNDKVKWHMDIPTYQKVVYREVYPGIDLVYSGNQRRLKYTFYLQPGTDLNQIQMNYEGIEGLSQDATGELVIQTEWGEMRDAAPVAYQKIDGVKKATDVSFSLIGEKSVGFAVGDYDPNFMLVLDPGYSTYLGGSGNDIGRGVAVDSSGNVYVTGRTDSSDFPTQNPYLGDTDGFGGEDVFVTKLNGGDNLVYSTYLGGTGDDYGRGIAVDINGNAYVTGDTRSSNFPTTQNTYQNNHSGKNDAFVTKLSSSGSSLAYSTYLGRDDDEIGEDIAVDSFGNVYVTGLTASDDFPTKNPYQSNQEGTDVFVTKLNISGDSLIYSTYIGGDSLDEGLGIAVDSLGNVYVTGLTASDDFPTKNPYQDSHAGGSYDTFVVKLNISGDALVYSTYMGGSDQDWGQGIALDSSGNAYVAGRTRSSNFPTYNPFQENYGGGQWDSFVTKLNISGNSLIYSTYIGGSDYDECQDIGTDSSGNAYVAGYTKSTNFPVFNPYQSNLSGGGYDAFVASFLSDDSLGGPRTIYVSTTGDDGNDGLSWTTAKATIQAGINVASDGDTVLVKYGTYNITNSIDFNGKNLKLASDDGTHTTYEDAATDAEQCIIDAGKNCRVFYFHNGETSEAVVDGFTIRNGYIAVSGAATSGGGIYCQKSNPTIKDNIITENWANYGGGIFCDSTSMIKNNIITGNSADSGGGIHCVNLAPTIQDNKITNNSAASGGGIYCSYGSSATIVNNIITDNLAKDNGGGIYSWNSPSKITKNIISDNLAYQEGGGIYCSSSPKITKNTINGNSVNKNGGGIYCYHSSSTITNNIITDNSAKNHGGGVYCYESNSKIQNNTITGNSANGVYCKDSDPTIVNSILWNNTGKEIYDHGGGILSHVTYSDVKGSYPGEGNINGDPAFMDAENGNYHLKPGSPCIDAGTATDAPSEDIEGNPRPLGSGVDMGAYETKISPQPKLVVSSDSIDFSDVQVNQSKSKILTITNEGTAEKEITSIKSDQSEFTVDRTAFTISPDKSQQIQISFKPTTEGLIDATLMISSNAGEKTISLSGKGILPPPEAHTVTVKAEPSSIVANGVSTSIITVTVKSKDGRLVKDETVTLTADSGVIPEVATNNNDGTYTAEYTSATTSGKVVITANTGNGKTGSVEIELTEPAARTPSFQISAINTEQQGAVGEEVTYNLSIVGVYGFEQEVELSAADLPKDVSATFESKAVKPTAGNPLQSSKLTISIGSDAPIGKSDFAVFATSGEKSKKIELSIDIAEKLCSTVISVLTEKDEIKFGQGIEIAGKLTFDCEVTDSFEIVLTFRPPSGEEVTRYAYTKPSNQQYSANFNEIDELGDWTVTAGFQHEGYQSASESTKFSVVKGESSIEWLTETQRIEVGETISLQGKLSPALEGESISIREKRPEDSFREIAEVKTNFDGIFSGNIIFDQEGEWQFRAIWDGSQNYESCSSESATFIVKSDPGKAVFLLAGELNTAYWNQNRRTILEIKETFKHRDFKEEDIAYLDVRENSDNLNEYFAASEPLKKRFKLAITEWAKSELSDSKKLYVYIIGHGTKDGVTLQDKSTLTPEELDEWLSEIPQDVKVYLFIESCYSGIFITKKRGDTPILPRENRVIICSSRSDLSSRIIGTCFTKEFFKLIKRGKQGTDIKTSFEEAKELFEEQVPQIDADGDGIPNGERSDILAMKDVYIPYPFQTLGEEDIPEFIEVSEFPETYMPKKTNIKAKLSGSDIERVWIEVVTPDLQDELYIDLSDSQIDLVDTDGDGVYEAGYSFNKVGKYSIYFYAVNKDGYSARAAQTTFSVVNPDVTQDGNVDIFDLVAVGSDFGKEGKNLMSDVNGDNEVNIFDLVIVGKHFGETVPAAPAIRTRRTPGSQRSDQELLTMIYELLKSQPNPTPQMQLALLELEKLLLRKKPPLKLPPAETKLLPNFPNPFNPDTWIPFQLAKKAKVSISIYEVNGKLIRKIELGELPAGFYSTKGKAAYWDGCNSTGERVSSGVYFLQFDADEYRKTRRMTIVK